MLFTWFKIFNLTEFNALDLPSKTYTVILEAIGQKDILVTKGELVSITYEGVFLPSMLNGINPYIKKGETEDELNYAIYLDTDSQDVYLGIEYEN